MHCSTILVWAFHWQICAFSWSPALLHDCVWHMLSTAWRSHPGLAVQYDGYSQSPRMPPPPGGPQFRPPTPPMSRMDSYGPPPPQQPPPSFIRTSAVRPLWDPGLALWHGSSLLLLKVLLIGPGTLVRSTLSVWANKQKMNVTCESDGKACS